MKVNAIFKVIILAATLVSCKKDRDESTACELTAGSLSGTYQLTALKYKVTPSSPEQDYLLFMEDCERDDRIQLNSNGTYIYTDAGIICDPNGSGDGTWSVTGNQLQSDGLLTGTISSYDCRILTYYLKDVITTGDRITFTMTKQ